MAGQADTGEIVAATPPNVLATRLATAAVQALVLYLLSEAATAPLGWLATQPLLFVPLLLVAAFAPLVVLFGSGQIGARALAVWCLVAAVVLAGLGWHDAARGAAPDFVGQQMFWPSWRLLLVTPPLLFVSHVLVTDVLIERRLLPPYARHFDSAWKTGLQVLLAGAFVGVFWGVLWLGAGLFDLLNVSAIRHLLEKRWFAIPATALALAAAIHATDVQPALIRGTRTMVLVLFAWLLPLLALILLGFLLCLPFLSLAKLWGTHFATLLLLSAAVLLVVLINTAYQDGTRVRPRLQRLAATLGALELVPLVGLAAWALALRVGQYGWTVERILAAAATAIAACHAIGYAGATIGGPWLKRLERTNEATAWLAVAVALALFSPLADPGRLMVASQLARLAAGAVAPEKFDYVALKFDGAGWGRAALAEIADHAAQPGAGRARAALALTSRVGAGAALLTEDERASRIDVLPAGRALPPGLFVVGPNSLTATSPMLCLHPPGPKCLARYLTLEPGGREYLLFLDRYAGFLMAEETPGQWRKVGTLSGQLACRQVRDALAAVPPDPLRHPFPDLVAAGRVLTIQAPTNGCDP